MRTNSRRQFELPRRGLTLLEIAVAAGLLTVLMVIWVQMLGIVSAQQRAMERRALALQTAQAIAEQLGNTPWKELTERAVQQLDMPAAAADRLPGARLAVDLHEEFEPIAKRAAIEISWRGPGGEKPSAVRLTRWIFPDDLDLAQ